MTKAIREQRTASHHRSLDYRHLGAALALIRDADTWWARKYCLLFMAITCVRSGEARMVTWDEINCETDTWTIPGSRMKAGIEHSIPLSTQAKEILVHAQEQGKKRDGSIFPGQRGAQYIASGSLPNLMKRLEIDAVPHGARFSFINWAARQTHIPQAAAEMVLAHNQPNRIVRALVREECFEARKPVMQEWANFLTETMGPVISPTPA